MAKTQQTEVEILFPERKVGDYIVKPFTFGQVGAALRIMTPYLAGVDLSVAEFSLSSINLSILMYAVTEGDCAGAFELVSMATGENVEHIKGLDAVTGFDLLQATWDVAIAPTFDLFKKKFQPEKPKVPPASPQPLSTSSEPDLVEPT